MPNVNPQVLHVLSRVGTPNFAQQLAMGEYAAGVLGENAKHITDADFETEVLIECKMFFLEIGKT